MKKRTAAGAAFALVLGASAAAASLPLLAGCSGGSGGGGGTHVGSSTDAVDSLSRVVRVAIRFTQPGPDGYASQIAPSVKADAEARGFVFQPTQIVFPPAPATGYYLKIDDKFYASGPDGVFSIPNGVAVPSGDVPLYKQLTDAAPLGNVPIAGSLKPGGDAPTTVYLDLHGRQLGTASEMDGTTATQTRSKSAPRACCVNKNEGDPGRAISDGCTRYDPDVTSNDPSVSACYDFDLSKGRIRDEDNDDNDGNPITGSGFCASKRVGEFVGTPCWNWTWGAGGMTAECINERAILQVTGPSCWANHKYRFCQNMDPADFSVTTPASLTVTVGQTLSLSVRNNTPKYDTMVTLTGDAQGTLSGTGVVGGGGSYHIEHYDDASTTYIANRPVTYVAPADLPDNKTEAYDTLTFTANGKTQTVTIRVTKPCGSDNNRAAGRSEVPCR